jgi:hypothetical protein
MSKEDLTAHHEMIELLSFPCGVVVCPRIPRAVLSRELNC